MSRNTRTRSVLLQQTKGKCFYCGVKLKAKRQGHRAKATIDHFIPLALGGLDSRKNKVAACHECNHRKGKMMPDDFIALLAREKA